MGMAWSAMGSSAQGEPIPIDVKWYLGVEAHSTSRGYLVESVVPDSPADAANIYLGDYIEKVNGFDIGYLPGRKFLPLSWH